MGAIIATLANLRTRISSELDLDNTASSAEQSLMDARANEAVVQILLRTRCYVTTATMALIADTDDYTLPTGILVISKIVDASDYPLQEVSPEEIHALRRAGSVTTSDTTTTRYAIDGSNLFIIYPTPTTAATLTVFYVPRPTAMSDGTHDSSTATYGGVPSEFDHLVEFYACARLASYDDDQSSAQGERYMLLFERGIADARKRLNMKGGRKLAPARVGGGLRPYIPTDPSADVGR